MFQVPQVPMQDLMTRHVVTVSMDESLRNIQALFQAHSFHHVLVVDNNKLVGVISDRDLLRNISPFVGHEFTERPQDLATLNRRAHQIMSRQLITALPDTQLVDGIGLILQNEISCLPIVDERMHSLGIVTWHDILRALVPLPPPSRPAA